MAVQRERWISPEEYLELDRASLDVKYEYIDGHMYAMSGGTIDHAQIAMNLIRALDDHFQKGSCRVFSSDVRVQVAENKYFYPDVTVSCNSEDWQQGKMDTIRFPRLAIEVLSPSAEAHDRRKKSLAYQACPTIQEYALINTQYQMVEIFRRYDDGNMWLYQQYGPGQEAELARVKFTIPLGMFTDALTYWSRKRITSMAAEHVWHLQVNEPYNVTDVSENFLAQLVAELNREMLFLGSVI